MSITRRISEFWGTAGLTVTKTSTNAIQNIDTGIADIGFKNSAGVLISSIFISCTANALRYSFTRDPASGGLGHVLAANADVWIRGADNIRAFKFRSAVDGSHALLAITPFYGDE